MTLNVKARFEIPKTIKFSDVRSGLLSRLSAIEGSVGNVNLWVDETTLNTYIIAVTVKSSNLKSDEMRGKILENIIEFIEPLKNKN